MHYNNLNITNIKFIRAQLKITCSNNSKTCMAFPNLKTNPKPNNRYH